MDESDIDNDSSSSESSESSEDDELNDGNEVMKNFIFYPSILFILPRSKMNIDKVL